MKRITLISIFICLAAASPAEEPDFTVQFAQRGERSLSMDVYMPRDTMREHWCVIYSYGGGFVENNQKEASVRALCRCLADDGYVAIATDYRLGLQGVVMKGTLSMVKPLGKAVNMAAEDVLSATSFVLDHAAEWGVRPDGIVLCGSSAGAISSLQADYELCNRSGIAACLPEDFHYAGVVSFAGAVYSKEGKCDYTVHAPAPTLLFHGIDDRLVNYGKTAFLNIRFSGSDDLVKRFKKNGWTHEIVRFVGEQHSVAVRYRDNYDDMVWFIDNVVKTGRHFEIDKTVLDSDRELPDWDLSDPASLYGAK